jgi:DNA-binding NarL/FixJ family response regulator
LLGAAERVVGHSVAIEAFLPAVSAGLGVLEDDVFRFRHPLIRSAVYQDASAPSRRRAHAALADVLLGEPDRRVWHLAAAATAADETVACELEAAAERARRRGGADVAVTALRRAADLSADDERKAHRLLTAAGLSFELGRPAKAVSLLDGVEPGKLAPAGRGRLTLLRELVDPQPFPGIARWHSMIRSAQQLATDGETELALDLLWLLGSRAWWKDPGAEARRVLVTTAESIASIDDDVRVLSLLGYAAPFERGEPVAARLAQAASQEDYATESARLLAATAVVTGAWDVAPQFLRASLGGMRSQGRLAQLPRMLVMQAMVAAQMGDWTVAMPAAEEARTLAIETGQPVWAGAADASAALAAAHRGDEDMAEALAAAAERAVPRLGASHVLALVQISRGAAALAGGHHLEAYDHLRRLFARDDPAHHWTMRWWALDDYVEAAIRTGHRPVVEPLVDELHSLAQLTPACWTHAVLDHARALLATDADAAGRFRAALEAGPEHCLFHRGRVLLSFGQWLRRQRRIESSRAPLRAAAESFDAVGAIAWGARARQELRASGETARRRVPDAWDQLTPQELQIARLASEGLTNREIGLQLYLSHRTVGTHLYRLFPKLGVTSRSELRAALQEIVG